MQVFGTLDPVSLNFSIGLIITMIILPIFYMVGLGIVCRAIVKSKGYPNELNHGFLWGFFLGLIGLIVCALKPVYGYNGMNGGPYYGGQPNNGMPINGQQYNEPFGPQPGSQDWYCSCGAPNPPDSRICLFCGNTRGH